MNKVVPILFDVIDGLIATIDEQNLLIQKMLTHIREEATSEPDGVIASLLRAVIRRGHDESG